MIKKYDYFIGNRRTAKEVSRRKIQESSNSDYCELGGGVTNRNTETCQRNVQVISVLSDTSFEEIKPILVTFLCLVWEIIIQCYRTFLALFENYENKIFVKIIFLWNLG